MIAGDGEYAEEDGMRQVARIIAAGAVALTVAGPVQAHEDRC